MGILWYRNDEVVYSETALSNQGSSGLGFTDWQPAPSEWLPGTYRVEILVRSILKTSGTFTVEGYRLRQPPQLKFPSIAHADTPTHVVITRNKEIG